MILEGSFVSVRKKFDDLKKARKFSPLTYGVTLKILATKDILLKDKYLVSFKRSLNNIFLFFSMSLVIFN